MRNRSTKLSLIVMSIRIWMGLQAQTSETDASDGPRCAAAAATTLVQRLATQSPSGTTASASARRYQWAVSDCASELSTVCSSRIPFCNSRSTVASTVWGRMRLWVNGGTPLRGPDGGERLGLAALHAITP